MIESVDADVLVETTASNYKDAEPGMSHIMAAMRRGMHVISVNKGPKGTTSSSVSISFRACRTQRSKASIQWNRWRWNPDTRLCKK